MQGFSKVIPMNAEYSDGGACMFPYGRTCSLREIILKAREYDAEVELIDENKNIYIQTPDPEPSEDYTEEGWDERGPAVITWVYSLPQETSREFIEKLAFTLGYFGRVTC